MAKLLLIKTAKEGVKEVDDIVGIFPDTWKFSATEQEMFKIVDVEGDYKTLLLLMPTIKTLYKIDTLEWSFSVVKKEVWLDSTDGIYKDLVRRWKHRLCYKDEKIQQTYGRNEVNQVDAGTIE